MFQYIFVLLVIVLTLVNDIYAHVDGAKLEEECKIADICRHDQVPICGIDSCGEMRTFIDTCDMHEFNCDSKKVKIINPKKKKIETEKKTTTENEDQLLYLITSDKEIHEEETNEGLRDGFRGLYDKENKIDYTQKPAHECWVTCKRGRSFKKPLYNADCNINSI